MSATPRAAQRAPLGEDRRTLWSTPIKERVVDLGAFAVGIRPTQRGGSQ